VQNAAGFRHLLLQQFQLLPRTTIGGRQYQIQIVGAGIDHAERLPQLVNQTAHHRPKHLVQRIGGDIGSGCEHYEPELGGENDYTPDASACKQIYAGSL
jgi:hypothetical protein